jgi:hypothetical protein
VALATDGAETVLSYTAEGRVGGKLAQIGQRLIDAAARKTADDFFDAFARELAPPAAETETAPAPAAAKASSLPSARFLWVAAAAALAMTGLLVWQVAAR